MNVDDIDYDFLYKIVLIGDSCVGKSNILARYTGEDFMTESKSTIGVEFATRTVIQNKKIIKVQIWDTAGQERYRSITRGYYRGAKGIIIVYDITNRTSFNNVEKWYDEVHQFDENVCYMLIGNKSDLDVNRQVSYEEALSYAQNKKFIFLETSALDNSNIIRSLNDIVNDIYMNNDVSTIDTSSNVTQKLQTSEVVSLRVLQERVIETKTCCHK